MTCLGKSQTVDD